MHCEGAAKHRPLEADGAALPHDGAEPGGEHYTSPMPSSDSRHDSLREGARLGLIVATSVWVWVALVDLIVGEPFHTFAVLGGIVVFTLLHYLLHVAYGVAIVSGLHGVAREPRLAIAVAFGFVIIEIALALITVLLSQMGLGSLAWVRIFGGNVIGIAVAYGLLSRGHALKEALRKAERQEEADE